MEDFVIRGNLFELYGGLLNEAQRHVYSLHINDDMSFTEIGEETGTSRQAAQEIFMRADRKLFETEKTLGLSEKFSRIRALSEEILEYSEDPVIRELAGEIRDGI